MNPFINLSFNYTSSTTPTFIINKEDNHVVTNLHLEQSVFSYSEQIDRNKQHFIIQI